MAAKNVNIVNFKNRKITDLRSHLDLDLHKKKSPCVSYLRWFFFLSSFFFGGGHIRPKYPQCPYPLRHPEICNSNKTKLSKVLVLQGLVPRSRFLLICRCYSTLHPKRNDQKSFCGSERCDTEIFLQKPTCFCRQISGWRMGLFHALAGSGRRG